MTRATAAPWAPLGASVRGASHARDGSPNQDALLTATQGDAAMALVADGHGGARHFRSAEGARLAVEAGAAILRDFSPRLASDTLPEKAQRVAAELPAHIVQEWRASVHDDLARRPLADDELDALRSAEGDEAVAAVQADPAMAYGATLLLALAAAGSLVLAQLGDGDIVLVDARGRARRPLPPDERLAGHLTTSICGAGAEQDFRTTVIAADPADAALLLLATDGYANSFRSDADFLKVGSDFLALLRRHGAHAVQQQLPDILAHASTHGSGDDITVALLPAPGAEQAPVALAPADTPPADHAQDAGARDFVEAPVHRRHRWSALSIGLLVLLAWWWVDRPTGVPPVREQPMADAEAAAASAASAPAVSITPAPAPAASEADRRSPSPPGPTTRAP